MGCQKIPPVVAGQTIGLREQTIDQNKPQKKQITIDSKGSPMIIKANYNYSQTAQINRHIQLVLKKMMNRLNNLDTVSDCLHAVRNDLERLPLATPEYDLATLRIDNARRYLASNEQGAASYELRLLAGALQKQFEPAAESPAIALPTLEPPTLIESDIS